MDKMFVVTGIRYSTLVEEYHTRTELFHHIIGIYTTKKHADEIAESIKLAREEEYFPDSIKVEEYQLHEGTYYPISKDDIY